jgi:hypothetical protein
MCTPPCKLLKTNPNNLCDMKRCYMLDEDIRIRLYTALTSNGYIPEDKKNWLRWGSWDGRDLSLEFIYNTVGYDDTLRIFSACNFGPLSDKYRVAFGLMICTPLLTRLSGLGLC